MESSLSFNTSFNSIKKPRGGREPLFFIMMRHLILTLFLLLPLSASAQNLTSISDTFKFSVTVGEREATVHYSGTQHAPIGIGSYSTKNGGWGPKFAIRSFYGDDVTTGRFTLQRQESGIRVILPGRESVAIGPASGGEQVFNKNTISGSRSYKRDLTVGATRTLDGRYAGLSFFLESGVTVSRNYQAARVGGVRVWRKHPGGYHTWHPNIGLGTLLKLSEHVSVQVGYNYTHGDVPPSHDVQFGIGFTDFR